MKDIISISDGKDLGLAVSSLPKSANLIAVQLGDLEYLKDFGIDKRYFLNSPYLLQLESFKAYVVGRLAQYQINVNQVVESLENLFAKLNFQIAPEVDYSNGFSKREIIANVLTDADGAILTDADGSPLADAF